MKRMAEPFYKQDPWLPAYGGRVYQLHGSPLFSLEYNPNTFTLRVIERGEPTLQSYLGRVIKCETEGEAAVHVQRILSETDLAERLAV